MHDPAITAVATVACDTPPGVYPVERSMPGGPADGGKGASWVTVAVADIGEAERAACPGKVAALPTATIRCDAGPGLYEVRWVGNDEVWARYRVAPIDDAARSTCQDGAAEPATGRAPWLVGGAAAVLGAAGAGACVLARRRRRGSSR